VSFGESVEVAVGAGEADRDAAAQREVAEVGHEWHGSPARVRLRRVLRSASAHRKGSAIRRSTSEFFGVIRVGRQHSVSPANPGDPAV
jgi:hypothetical protein